ncbi:TonB-dependent receptor, partial [bacterium]|nr:TonB-dependent receptor [bacterium]
DEWEIGSKNLFVLLPGVRMDDDSQFGNHISPKLSFRHDPTEKTTVRASYGSGFRAPDFKEMYLLFEHPGVGYRIIGNPDLEPETSLSSSASVEYKPMQNLWFSVSGYRHDVEGLIQAELEPIVDDPLYHMLGVYRNVSKAMLQGADVSARWSPIKEVSFDVGYSYLESEDKETGQELEGRATHKANSSVSVNSKDWTFSMRGSWVGKRPFTTEGSGYSTEEADSYLLADTRISYRLNSQTLFCGVNNLLNEGDNDYLPIRPRAIFAGIDMSF